ncbi:right-handed parallel beta-helix repeat-containing protein [Methylococcaceae bacterium WWC4]|nr:right-handed parallel beta-helix repeat-containing protein [Methylococcaceae bacterium WWC4]
MNNLKSQRNIPFKIFLVILFITSNRAVAIDYYINPNGNDSWSGRTPTHDDHDINNGPFRTIEKAQTAIRQLKKNTPITEKITVHIAGGTYYLEQALTFNDQDSGYPGLETVWQAEPGAEAILSGGIPITCSSYKDDVHRCPVTKSPKVKETIHNTRIQGDAPRFEVYANNKRMTLARWPDHEWAHVKTPLDDNRNFSAMEAIPNLNDDITGAQIHIYPGNDWFDQFLGVQSIDPNLNSIKTIRPTQYKLQTGRQFYLQNLRALLNAPGEWHYDKQSKNIYLIPFTVPSSSDFVLTSLPNLLYIEKCNHITFERLHFQHSANSAIVIKKSNNILLNKLEIQSVGGKGIEIVDGENVKLSNSEIFNTGLHGVFVSGGNRNTLQASHHNIYNNHIHDTGKTLLTYSPSIEIGGVGNKIDHNLLERGFGSAILINGNEHLIEKNEIHQFCLQAADCGAIYSGRDWSARGNVISNNYIHDIVGYGLKNADTINNVTTYQSPDFAIGVYLDDGASGFTISHNIFENAGAVSLYIHGGRDNQFRNNYITTNKWAIWISKVLVPNYDWSQNQKKLESIAYNSKAWTQKYPELTVANSDMTIPQGNRIEHNVIESSQKDGLMFRYLMPTGNTTISNNIVWSTVNKATVEFNSSKNKHQKVRAPWQDWVLEGVEKNSILAPPCISVSNKKLNFCSDSTTNNSNLLNISPDIGLISPP